MSENNETLDYQGPQQDWQPHVGGIDVAQTNKVTVIGSEGYFDLNYFQTLLEEILTECGKMYSECERQLNEYSLTVDTNDDVFLAAHDQVYPVDDTPGYVTFDEYKYLLEHNSSNASQYIINAYETKVRGSSGTNALDISLITLYINSECKRIKEFVNEFIGEVDDSAEFRTIEIFQDWAEDAKAIVAELWKALQGQIQRTISGSELDRIDAGKSGEFQALFQVKLNTINKNILTNFNQLLKNWETPSQTFYNKNLGPAMKFRLRVGRSILEGLNTTSHPVLAAEASATTSGLNSNFEVALSDSIKRNHMFFDTIVRILTNVAQRDTYVKYMEQLSHKGKTVSNPFVPADSIEQADAVKQTRILDADRSLSASASAFYNYHSDLSGLETTDAHPQYLARTGGADSKITGNIEVASGVTIDGIDLSEHTHDGINAKKIRGANIEYGTLTTDNLDLSGTYTSVPQDLTMVSLQSSFLSPGKSKVQAKISFNVDETNIAGYEFEIIDLD